MNDQPIPAGELPTKSLMPEATAQVRTFNHHTKRIEDVPRPGDVYDHTGALAHVLRLVPQALGQLQGAAVHQRVHHHDPRAGVTGAR